LDAGCGTGNYSIELARRGYNVTGLDISPELISEAKKKLENKSLHLKFEIGDILKLSSEQKFDGILCRGVLNDIIDDISRREAFFSFAGALRMNAVLILDVREWNSTAIRKTKEPVFEKSIETDKGTLTFRSVTQLDKKTRRILVNERHIIKKDGKDHISEYNFIMKCWTKEELQINLVNAGFSSIIYFGDYDSNIHVGSSDRIVAITSLKKVMV